MDDVVRQILAAIEEAEQDARAATQGPWRHTPEKHWRKPGTAWCEEAVFAGPAGADAVCVAGTGNSDDPQSMADAVHIARHDPDAVLRRCAADREIVELHGIVWRDIGWLAEEDGEVVEEEAELPVCGLCVPRHSSFPRREDVPVGRCRTVRLLARGYGISAEKGTS